MYSMSQSVDRTHPTQLFTNTQLIYCKLKRIGNWSHIVFLLTNESNFRVKLVFNVTREHSHFSILFSLVAWNWWGKGCFIIGFRTTITPKLNKLTNGKYHTSEQKVHLGLLIRVPRWFHLKSPIVHRRILNLYKIEGIVIILFQLRLGHFFHTRHTEGFLSQILSITFLSSC